MYERRMIVNNYDSKCCLNYQYLLSEINIYCHKILYPTSINHMGSKKTNEKKKMRGLETPGEILEKLSLKIDEKKDTSFTNAYKDIAENINQFLENALIENNDYTPLILKHKDEPIPEGKNKHDFVIIDGIYRKLEGEKYISGRTLSRMLDLENVDRRKIYAVACYIGEDSTSIDEIIDAAQNNDDKPEKLLSGGWDLYYYQTIKSKGTSKKKYEIRKTGLWVDYQWSNPISARLRFPNEKGEHIFSGTGEIKNGVLVLIFEGKNKKGACIHLFCNIPHTIGKEVNYRWILNAGALSNGTGIPTIGNAILIKNRKGSTKATSDKITSLSKESVSDEEREIMSYLIRNDDRPVRTFHSEDLAGLIETNEYEIEKSESGRDNYVELKSIFQKSDTENYGWYSFSRIYPVRYDITFFRWKIIFNDIERKVEVERERDYDGGRSLYKGEFVLKEKQLYARLVSQTKDKKLKSIVGINNPKEKGIRFISATTFPDAKGESSNIAVREILCFLSKEEIKTKDLKTGLMNIYTFASLQGITSDNVLYLSSRALSTLSFPSDMNYRKHFARIKEAAISLSGTFYLLMRNKYMTENTELLLIKLEIDRLANVTMKMRYSKDEDEVIHIYYGRAEYYSTNAHLHLETDTEVREKQKIASLILDVKQDYANKELDCIRGVCVKTDHKGKVGAYPLVMIKRNVIDNLKKDSVQQGIVRFTENAPKVVGVDEVDTSLYAHALPNKYQKENVRDYFFQLSPYEE